MTLHFQTKDLREAVASLQPVLSSKQTLPVLGAVQFGAVESRAVSLSATNTDVWMDVHVPVPGAKCPQYRVPGKLLHEALSRISAAECQISTTDSHAVLTAGNAKLKLPLIVDPLPQLPEADWSKPFIVPGLQDKLSKCLKFASKDPSRWLLNSVYLSKGKLEASDGRRGIRITAPECKGSSIVPSELAGMIVRTEGEVQIRTALNLIEFSGEGWTITGKQIESTTGEWARSIDGQKYGVLGKVRSSAAELTEASKLATFGVADPLATALRFRPEEGRVILHTVGEQAGEAAVNAELETMPEWAINARFFEAALSVMPQDEVELILTDVFALIIEQQDTKVAVSQMRPPDMLPRP